MGATPSNSYYNGELLWVTISDIQDSFISTTIKKITSPALKDYHLKLFPIDSIAISLRGSLKFGILLKEATVSENCCLLFCDPSRLNYFYLYYYFLYLRSINFPLFYPRGSLFQTITIDVLKSLPIPFFPLSRQGQIVTFLNLKFDLIQELLLKIDLLLKKLEDYQASIIYEKIHLFDSFSSSIKLKYLFSIHCGVSFSELNSLYWNGSFLFITPPDMINTKYLSTSKRKITNLAILENSLRKFHKDSLVVSCRASIGNICILSEDAYLSRGCIGLQKKDFNNVFIDYVYYSLLASSKKLEQLGRGSTFKEITTTDLRNFLIFLPNYSLQQELCISLDHKMALLKNLQSHYRSLKAHLEEYQQSLLYETFQNLL